MVRWGEVEQWRVKWGGWSIEVGGGGSGWGGVELGGGDGGWVWVGGVGEVGLGGAGECWVCPLK